MFWLNKIVIFVNKYSLCVCLIFYHRHNWSASSNFKFAKKLFNLVIRFGYSWDPERLKITKSGRLGQLRLFPMLFPFLPLYSPMLSVGNLGYKSADLHRIWSQG